MADLWHVLAQIIDLPKQGDGERLLDLFSGDPSINVPFEGEVQGEADLKDFIRRLSDCLSTSEAQSRLLNEIAVPECTILELIVRLDLRGKSLELPVAIVADLDEAGVRAMRIYHSTYPFTGSHIIRKPMLVPQTGLHEPAVVERYMRGLREPNIGLVLSLFTPDAYVREPSGDSYRHEGEEGRRAFYESALRDGGIPLQHCSSTFDGKTFAVEFIVDRWGRTEFATQAGMAVYQLTGDNKLIEAVRIYDDVTPPEAKKS